MRRYWVPAALVALAVLGLGAALVQRPGDRALATDVFLLFLGFLVLALVLRETAVSERPLLGPSPLDLAQRRPEPAEEQVPELERVERVVSMARQTVFDVHYLLRPLLQEVARHRLASRGVDLDAADGSSEALLGPDAWEIVRPDRPRPTHHFKRGIAMDSLDRAVSSLEQI